MTSDFGKGCTYSLALFAMHKVFGLRGFSPALWFYGAGDHVIEMQIPSSLPEALQKKLSKFRRETLEKRNALYAKSITEKDRVESVRTALNLLILIDRHLGIDAEKGIYE